MPRVSPAQNNFLGGEITPLFQGRSDFERYKQSLATCLNWLPTLQGGVTRRPGTYYVANAKNATSSVRLSSFEFSVTQAYILEWGETYVRFFKNQAAIFQERTITGITQAADGVITAIAHGFSNGQTVQVSDVSGMTQINGLSGTVVVVTADTFRLGINTSGFSAYTSGGIATRTDAVYEIVTPYDADDVFELKFIQSLDTLYIVHPFYAPQKLTRTAHSNWTLTAITFLDGPYLAENTTVMTLNNSGTAVGAAITITASAALWGTTAQEAGRVVRIRHTNTWGWARITTITSSTIANAVVGGAFGATGAQARWRLGLWSVGTGYPACASFHEDRLCFAGPSQRLDFSVTGDYENFAPTPADATATIPDAQAVSAVINTDDINVIRDIRSDEKGLLVFTAGGEFVLRAASGDAAISPSSIIAKPQSSFGSADIAPIRVGRGTLHVSRSARKLREVAFDSFSDGFRSTDLSILSEHITNSGIRQIAFQKEKQPVIWCVLTNGTLAALTYERDIQELRAGWSRHQLGGATNRYDYGEVQSVATVPSSFSPYYEVWFVVYRYVNGAFVQHIEFLTDIWDSTFERDRALYMDCALQRGNFAITGITKANPAVVTTSTAHGYSNGQFVVIDQVVGMTEVNHKVFEIAGVTSTTFQLVGTNSTAFGTYAFDGRANRQITSVSGLDHLEGQPVDLLTDGSYQTATVASGVVTPGDAFGFIAAGLHYESEIKMLRLDAGSSEGASLGKIQRTHRVGLLLEQAQGIKIGYGTKLFPIKRLQDPEAEAGLLGANLFSGMLSENLQAKYDLDNQLIVRVDQPFPATVLSILPRMEVQDGG